MASRRIRRQGWTASASHAAAGALTLSRRGPLEGRHGVRDLVPDRDAAGLALHKGGRHPFDSGAALTERLENHYYL
jgi:hypothetical protein